MEERIEIPPGLMRTWKVAVITALTCIVFASAGVYVGHDTARVVTKEVRVDVPTPACRDEMIQVQDDDDKKHIACSHPDQHGSFQAVTFNPGVYAKNVPYLICTCPHAQLDLDSGAK